MTKMIVPFFFLLCFLACQTEVDAVCRRRPGYAHLGGYCYKRNRETCSGMRLNRGCSGRKCSLCVTAAKTGCIAKNACLMSNGTCLKKPDWATCDREVDSMFCSGMDCACCRNKKCVRTAACKDQGGYCIRKKIFTWKNHVCNGQEVAGGCGPTNCVCCVPNPAGK